MGAAQVAVMELSVGAGLLTVLLVYAVSVVGDDALDPASVIPKPLAFGLVGAVAVILDWMAFPVVQHSFSGISAELVTSLWHSRVLDVWIQRVLLLGIQPACVDIGKRSTRGFCGLWLRLCWDQWNYRTPRNLPDSSLINTIITTNEQFHPFQPPILTIPTGY
jgi:hypothetical protein